LPHRARLLGDPHLPTDFRHRRAAFGLSQGGQDLLVGMPTSSCHRRVPLGEKKTTPQVRSSSALWSTFWVLGHDLPDSHLSSCNHTKQVTSTLTDQKALAYPSRVCHTCGWLEITCPHKNTTVTQRAPRKSILPRLPCSSAQS